MKLGQAVKMALKSILAKKGRSFLTMLGIIIGIAAVMTIVSVVEGYNKQMMDMFNSMGTNLVQVNAQYFNGEDMFEPIYNYCQRLGDIVVGVSPSAETWDATVQYGAKTSDTMDWQNRPRVLLGGDQFSLCSEFTVAKGRDISRLDIDEYNQICVLGSGAARAFFDYADPLGQDITIGGLPFKVVGVYREKGGTNFGQSPDNVIVLPYSCSRFLNSGNSMSEFVIKVKDSQHISEVITRVGDYVNSLTQNQTIGWGSVWSQSVWQEETNSELNMISLVLGGIAGISLLVGGIGIMNIMLVTVTERTREIGIRRAIGAERGSIVAQFLVEAGMICGIGGIIGIGIGYLGTNIAGRFILQGASVLPSPAITLGAFAFSVSLGIIFGMYPAIKASGLQPVVALRAE